MQYFKYLRMILDETIEAEKKGEAAPFNLAVLLGLLVALPVDLLLAPVVFVKRKVKK